MCPLSPLSGFDSVLSSAGGWTCCTQLLHFKLYSKCMKKQPTCVHFNNVQILNFFFFFPSSSSGQDSDITKKVQALTTL